MVKAIIIEVDHKLYWWAGESEIIEHCRAVEIIQSRDCYGPAHSANDALDGYRRMLEIDD